MIRYDKKLIIQLAVLGGVCVLTFVLWQDFARKYLMNPDYAAPGATLPVHDKGDDWKYHDVSQQGQTGISTPMNAGTSTEAGASFNNSQNEAALRSSAEARDKAMSKLKGSNIGRTQQKNEQSARTGLSSLEMVNGIGSQTQGYIPFQDVANPIPSPEQNLANIRQRNQDRQIANQALEERKEQIAQVHEAIVESHVLNTYTHPTDVEDPVLGVPEDLAEKIKSRQLIGH